MKKNFKADVIAAIAETQDGKVLNPKDNFSSFMLRQIERNIDNKNEPEEIHYVDTTSLITDFEYMIDQLKKAIKPLKEFEEQYETL